jgi:peptidyl-prolyl cis-trans isomerase A (cyclophilin A)
MMSGLVQTTRANVLIFLIMASFGGLACGGGIEGQQPPPAGTPVRMTIETTRGTMVLELYPDKAPITVAAIAELAEGSRQWIDPGNGMKMENEPYYDDIVFHRVIPSFMIQAGDPLGKGYGGPGFEFQDEFSEDLTFDRPGRLAMANPGRPNSNGGQFFITVAPTPQLNFKHTIFGQVIEGQDIAVAISKVPRDGGDKPRQDVIIQSMTIHRE